ncbi:MAG TPA: pyridoxamine 5'-phosphate oxidase family protein [Mycobacterium sp.]|nr:pyridoxamine 5'-phosphate oxidase family protein [Mycobacterium sp.]
MLGELNRRQIEQVLRAEVIGRIGCVSDGRVYVVPVTYVYDGTCAYGHSMDGAKLRAMRANPHVCFEVEHVRRSTGFRGRFCAVQGGFRLWGKGVGVSPVK